MTPEFMAAPPNWPHAHLLPRCAQEADTLMRVAPDRVVFVFGSNLAGRHGGGAARVALEHFDAVMGHGYGWHGRSYAVPTMDVGLRTLPLHLIAGHVARFIVAAASAPRFTFYVTAIGTGIAGLTHEQMAALFANASRNCLLPPVWLDLLSSTSTQKDT